MQDAAAGASAGSGPSTGQGVRKSKGAVIPKRLTEAVNFNLDTYCGYVTTGKYKGGQELLSCKTWHLGLPGSHAQM